MTVKYVIKAKHGSCFCDRAPMLEKKERGTDNCYYSTKKSYLKNVASLTFFFFLHKYELLAEVA